MKVFGLIPVRLESSRLPGKALKDIGGLPAIVHVFKRCEQATSLDEVYVCTDSDEIKKVVEEHGGKVLLTGAHRNGSERIHEAAQKLNCDTIINIQGDEVLVNPEHIDLIVNEMKTSNHRFILGVTPFEKENSPQDFKAVLDLDGNMLYCSREDIPSSKVSDNTQRLKVVFIVGFTKNSLATFVNWSETELELREPNEFLRILQHGEKIKTVLLDDAKISLDTQDDLETLRNLVQLDKIVCRYHDA